ncbi:zinc finger (C2H2 type) family protein [Striga asiatica]|uniref:Zinc finger (C2H2 type) family protein n=1 Tax=Striga asiatica TaxID=4170 RepID=A0A5A7QRC4_STRAF|nr:zinc finger (C2H2 type) family protein [Striga asiatica]
MFGFGYNLLSMKEKANSCSAAARAVGKVVESLSVYPLRLPKGALGHALEIGIEGVAPTKLKTEGHTGVDGDQRNESLLCFRTEPRWTPLAKRVVPLSVFPKSTCYPTRDSSEKGPSSG